MIIEVKFKNWMSFRDETHLSLVATQERRLMARVPKIKSTPTLRVSPVALFYGGNASGKSNLFSLFAFLKRMVISPISDKSKDIPVANFMLDDSASKLPTEIEISFLAKDNEIYKYHVSFDRTQVLLEELAIATPTNKRVLFARANKKVKLVNTALGKDKRANAFAEVINKNQLFLAIAGTSVPLLSKPYDWFRHQLKVISPNATYGGFERMLSRNKDDSKHLASLLSDLDTGICKIDLEKSDISALPEELDNGINNLSNNDIIDINMDGERIFISKLENEVTVSKIVTFHKGADNPFTKFNMRQESDGSRRLMDILPAFIDLEKKSAASVYVIDELDRSWHYELSRRLLGIYLSQCSTQTCSQLLFSTHDLMLMDQALFRRDEMRFVERDSNGVSSIYSLANCGIRHDKDIRKLYLQGAIGGLPSLLRYGSLGKT